MKSTALPLYFERRMYYGAKRIGFTDDGTFILDLFTIPLPDKRGGFFTTIPISDKIYRAENPTDARAELDNDALVIYDDYGHGHRISGDKALIDGLIWELTEQGLKPAAPPKP